MRQIILLFAALMLSGCSLIPIALLGAASDEEPMSQCIISIGDGEFRYGSFTQYVKAEGLILRIAESGLGCKGKLINVERDGVIVTIDE